MRIEVPEPIDVQTYVNLQVDALNLNGSASVRHCHRCGSKYILGIELSAGVRWKLPETDDLETRLTES